MICPHCKKPIPRGYRNSLDADIKDRAIELHVKGYSTHDIAKILEQRISASTVSRITKRKRK